MWNNGGRSNVEQWGEEHGGILSKGHAITGKDWIKWGMRQDNCGIMKKPNKQCTLMEIRNEVWGVQHNLRQQKDKKSTWKWNQKGMRKIRKPTEHGGQLQKGNPEGLKKDSLKYNGYLGQLMQSLCCSRNITSAWW